MKRTPLTGAVDLVVDGPEGLAQLRRPAARSAIRRIHLEGPLADEATEAALNTAYFACGCEQGSVAVMVALVGSVAVGLVNGFDGAFTWWRVGVYLAVAAVVGKAIGLAIARWRLQGLLHRLDRAAVR